MKKRAVDVGVAFIADDQAPEIAQPGEGPFNLPAMSIAPEFASILKFVNAGGAMRANQFNPSRVQRSSQFVAVVASIGNQSLRFAFGPTSPGTRHCDRGQRALNQGYFRRRGFNDSASQRNARAVDHHHPLRPFAFPGVSDAEPPFLAGAKLPSIKHWLQSSFFPASSSLKNIRQICSHRSCCSQSRNRRQQVLALGYSFGKSRHRAPVLRTQRMPSSTRRLSLHGRPRLLSFGRSGSIFFHCSSERNASRIPSFSSNCRKSTSTKYLQILDL